MPEQTTSPPRKNILPLLIAVGGLMITFGLFQGLKPGQRPVSVSEAREGDVVRDSPDNSPANTLQPGHFVQCKVMQPGRCFAGSPIKDTEAPGGFGRSDNLPKPVAAGSRGQGVYLLAEPNHPLAFGDQTGMRLVLVNRTDAPVAFPAQDSRLSIVQEAQDEAGNWFPIEFLQSSWCGNSYHKVTLPANQFWEFPVPRYQGSLKTKLRFTYLAADGKNIHSNEFEGSIDPSQFELPGDLRDVLPHGVINSAAYKSIGLWVDRPPAE